MKLYQGYTNYPTYTVALYLHNTQVYYEMCRSFTRFPNPPERIKAHVLEALILNETSHPYDNLPDLFHDLITYTLQDVNWSEIADSFKNEQ